MASFSGCVRAEGGEAAGGSGFHRSEGNAEPLGDLGLAQVGVVPQDDDLALLLGQGGEQADDAVAGVDELVPAGRGPLGRVRKAPGGMVLAGWS